MNDPYLPVRAAPHGSEARVVAEALGVDLSSGLSFADANSRLQRDGPNSLEVRHSDPWWFILGRQFTNVVVWLLIVATLLAWFTENHVEAGAILVVLIINGLIGFWIEWRAARALSALHYEARTIARVRRDGSEHLTDAARLVVGDVVIINAGDRVPADVRLVESAAFAVDESTFTGESMAVEKSVEPVVISSILADRRSMSYLGTLAVRGRATGLVTATGRETELGHIGRLIAKTASERTPLEKRLEELGRMLVYAVLAVAAVIAVVGVIRGDNFWLMIKVSISLAVAAVPEALPAMTTLILALGVLEMAKHRAIVRRLSAVEALGSTTVICADKTGTLTENRMTVTEVSLPDGAVEPVHDGQHAIQEVLLTAILCNEAVSPGVGDPTETALLTVARNGGMNIEDIRAKFPKIIEEPFDPATKRMITVHKTGTTTAAFLKGAPSAVLDVCSSYRLPTGAVLPLDIGGRARFTAANEEMAKRGSRVLAFARKDLAESVTQDIKGGFTFLGFLGMTDPPRKGVAEALHMAARAGIRVVMLTGDQLLTARAVARELGLGRNGDIFAMHSRELTGDAGSFADAAARAHVFARVSPEDKLRIVEALQAAGETVAVTGDGINDAPALKRADVGIAMGGRGTEVAKEAADIVLTDDNLPTIMHAIAGGRRIYANIIKFVHMLFSHNLGEVVFIFSATAAGLPLPLLPLQILWINIVTDIFPAFALAVEPSARDAMLRPPRPRSESLLSKRFLVLIGWQGVMLGLIVLGAYLWALASYADGPHARTVAMTALVAAQLGHLFNCRSRSRSAFPEFFSNPFIFAAGAVVILLHAAAIYFDPLSVVLGTTPLNQADFIVAVICVVTPIAIVELTKLFSRKLG